MDNNTNVPNTIKDDNKEQFLDSQNHKKSKNNNLIFILIIVVLLIVIGILLCDKFIKKDNKDLNNETITTTTSEKINKSSTTTTTTTTVATTTKKVDKELKKVEEYLSYVPIEYTSFIKYCADEKLSANNKECNGIRPYLDAYSKNKVTSDEIHNELLIIKAITELEGNCDLYPDEESGIDGCYAENDVEKQLKKMYNKEEIKDDKFKMGGASVERKNGFYIVEYLDGNYPLTKINEIVNYKYNNNELIILEQVLFFDDGDGGDLDYKVLKTTNPADILFSGKKDHFDKYKKAIEEVKLQLNKGNVFKHTFKKNDNGDYYWLSTEILNY